jgi:hypothetical protein
MSSQQPSFLSYTPMPLYLMGIVALLPLVLLYLLGCAIYSLTLAPPEAADRDHQDRDRQPNAAPYPAASRP